MKPAYFERAIFLSWYCSKRDCAFCYMSSEQNKKAEPLKSRRTLTSILAEAIICKACGWKIEFLSAGCNTFADEELLLIIKSIYEITRQKQWLNVGILNEKQLRLFKPYIEGVCGTVECITPKLRDKICPSKPLKEIEKMCDTCDKLKLKKTITIIIGLGETLEDFKYLGEFIKKNKIDKITFYRLKPQKGTVFENKKEPETEHYVKWIEKTREEFPDIKIVAGSWLSHLNEIHLLLTAGADNITKFPSIKLFNTKYAKKIESEVKKAGREFKGTLTKLPMLDLDEEIDKLTMDTILRNDIKLKLKNYLKK